MLELFIALFGGLFYGSKYLSEKSNLKAYDKQQAAYKSIFNDIESRYVANYETERWAKDFISSGRHYDEICSWFAEDFQYAIGKEWEKILQLPHIPASCICEGWSRPCVMPSIHMWVYHLLLAKQGKIDHTIPYYGYTIGGIKDKDMCIKFAERIESHLINAGVQDIRLALELDTIYGTCRRTPNDVCGGHIKIESLCFFPSHRLWDDTISKSNYSNI